LSNRLSLFFLAALALVLIGFSTALYLLARTYLHRQAEERLQAAMETLRGAVEDRPPEGLEWEGEEHRLTLGQDDGPEQVRWIVHDQTGAVVDHSANLGATTLGDEETGLVWRDGAPWYLARQQVEAKPTRPLKRKRYAVLVLTAGVSLGPLTATLRTLALTLGCLSVLVWLAAAGVGRWLCRRALAPVRRMADAARAMSAADLDQRLPGPGTNDELDDLRTSFNGLLCRLQEAFERQRRFTGDASHQLRTPLTAMRGQIEVALRRDRAAEDYRQTLERVQGRTAQLQQIVEALLFLARADAEAALDEQERLDLAALLPELTRHWADHPRAADLRVEGDGGGAQVRAQAVLLGQLLDNLIDNAFRYSEPGSPVTVRLHHEPGAVLLTVADEGGGINADDLPHVFEPFYRSPESRRRGRTGIGLGLAVVRRIATAFGGSVTAESEPGRGSRFTLRLPAACPPQPHLTEAPAGTLLNGGECAGAITG
jgi:heavy metal sensor kinase